jgi:uncharacterized protein (DUF2336 family)
VFQRLIALAQEPSSDKRRELMGQVADIFTENAETYSSRELALFGEIMANLLNQIERESRRETSQKLAPLCQTPRSLALQLAHDEAEIAAPMLQFSPVLTTDDLIELAKAKGQPHLQAIARRAHLESELTDVLLERGEAPVQQTLAANTQAEFSEWGGKHLTELAEDDALVRNALWMRAEQGGKAFSNIISVLPEGHRAIFEKLTNASEEAAKNLLAIAAQIAKRNTPEYRRRRLHAKIAAKEIKAGRRSLDTIVRQYSEKNWMLALAHLLASVAGIEEKFVINILAKSANEAPALLCRALGMQDETYRALCLARCERLKLPDSITEQWLEEFRALDGETARRGLRFITVRTRLEKTG